jgi:hypothetical protein
MCPTDLRVDLRRLSFRQTPLIEALGCSLVALSKQNIWAITAADGSSSLAHASRWTQRLDELGGSSGDNLPTGFHGVENQINCRCFEVAVSRTGRSIDRFFGL